MRLTKNEVSTTAFALVLISFSAAIVAWILTRKPFWICTSYKIDWTALTIVVGLCTYLFDRYKEQRRMLATRGVVQAIALNELENLSTAVAVVQQHVPHENYGLNENWMTTAEQIYYRNETWLEDLAAAVSSLNTPILDSLMEKLDALPKEQLVALSEILRLVGEIRRAPSKAKLFPAFGSREPGMCIELLDETKKRCDELQAAISNLFDEWKSSVRTSNPATPRWDGKIRSWLDALPIVRSR